MRPKEIAKAIARRCGFDICHFAPSSSRIAQLRTILNGLRINTVFDVGANIGQFGRELRRDIGYRGRIVSIEPMTSAHAALVESAKGDPQWDVAIRCAVGSVDGTATINIAANSVSSSLLPMLASHLHAAPGSGYSDAESVPIRKLDAIAKEYLTPSDRIFLKIDTQGYESHVLSGALETVARTVGIQLEVSWVDLYKGQTLAIEQIIAMRDLGFDLWGIWPLFAERESGRLLQADAVFIRSVRKDP